MYMAMVLMVFIMIMTISTGVVIITALGGDITDIDIGITGRITMNHIIMGGHITILITPIIHIIIATILITITMEIIITPILINMWEVLGVVVRQREETAIWEATPLIQ